MDELHNKFTVEDFKRLHAKFFGCLVSVEVGFQRRFPKEWEEYSAETFPESEDK